MIVTGATIKDCPTVIIDVGVIPRGYPNPLWLPIELLT